MAKFLFHADSRADPSEGDKPYADVGVVVELRKLANDAKVGGQSGERERRATAVGSSRRQAPAAAQWVLYDKSLAAGAWLARRDREWLGARGRHWLAVGVGVCVCVCLCCVCVSHLRCSLRVGALEGSVPSGGRGAEVAGVGRVPGLHPGATDGVRAQRPPRPEKAADCSGVVGANVPDLQVMSVVCSQRDA